MESSAVEAVAELTQIHLQMLGAGAVVGAVDKGFGIANNHVQPFQQLRIRVEVLVLVDIVLS